MLKTIKNIFKTGDATVKYPFAPLKVPKDMRGKPEHSFEQCIACAACAVACPANAIQMKTDVDRGTITWKINYGRCIFCGRCEEVCPMEAIKLSQKFELAVMKKSDLEETCTYKLQKCSKCGKYFAPRKEVDYAKRLLASMSQNKETVQALSSMDICPECKEKADALAQQRESNSSRGGQR